MIRPFLCLLVLWFAITGSAAPATGLAFHPDGAVLAVGGHRRVELRSVPEGRILGRIMCELPRIAFLDFDPLARFVVAAGGSPAESGAVLLLDAKNGTVLHQFAGFSDIVTRAAQNRSGWLAIASADSSAALYRIGTNSSSPAPIHLKGHSGPMLDIAWSPREDLVVTASADRSLKVWSAADGTLLRSLSNHTEPVHAITFRPEVDPATDSPAQCASGSDDQTVRIWQPGIGRMVRIIRRHAGPVFTLGYTPDGQKLFSAGSEGIIRQLDTESDEVLGEWKAHDEPIYQIAISPDGKTLASGDWAGKVRFWTISETGLSRHGNNAAD